MDHLFKICRFSRTGRFCPKSSMTPLRKRFDNIVVKMGCFVTDNNSKLNLNQESKERLQEKDGLQSNLGQPFVFHLKIIIPSKFSEPLLRGVFYYVTKCLWRRHFTCIDMHKNSKMWHSISLRNFDRVFENSKMWHLKCSKILKCDTSNVRKF